MLIFFYILSSPLSCLQYFQYADFHGCLDRQVLHGGCLWDHMMLLKMVCILDSIHDPVLLLEQVFKTLGLNQVFIRADCLSSPCGLL